MLLYSVYITQSLFWTRMRTSISLASFLASVSSQRRHIILPAIIITSPSNDINHPTCNFSSSASLPSVSRFQSQTIRRWHGGIFPGERDLTLYPPKLGHTKGARLMLARQGFPTGSFRLNCVETFHARDDQGRCLYQRMDFEEELETLKHGSMERPIQFEPPTHTPTVPPETLVRPRKRRRSRTTHKDLLLRHTWKGKRSTVHPSRDRLTLGSLSSAHTYTEGLCDLSQDNTGNPTSSLSTSISLRSFLTALESGTKWINPARNKRNSAREESTLVLSSMLCSDQRVRTNSSAPLQFGEEMITEKSFSCILGTSG